MQAILEGGRIIKRLKKPLFNIHNREMKVNHCKRQETPWFKPKQKNRGSTADRVSLLLFSLFKSERKGGLSESMHDRTRKTVNYGCEG